MVGLMIAAFLVAWLSGTRRQIRRALFIPILIVVAAALSAGYVAWLAWARGGVTTRLGWGIVAGVAEAVMLVPAITRQPVDRQLSRH